MALSTTAALTSRQTHTVNLDGSSYQVYTYRPAGEIKGLLLAFHGDSRNADGMRDQAMQIADKLGYFVVAPLFDTERFGDSDLYQQGGLINDGRVVTDRDDWTIARAKDFANWGAAQAGLDANDPTVLFGHSAGGQFLSRVAAFGDDSGFDKMIIANPSTHVWPSLTEKVGYGFAGGPFSAQESEALLRDYLADPVTIYLGDQDTGTVDLATGAAAMLQGENRLQRGLNVYEAAKAEAEARGWEFGWDLVMAPGVGHTSGGMLRSSAMLDAIETEAPTPGPVYVPVPEPEPMPIPAPVPAPATTDNVAPTKLGTSGSNSLTGTSAADVISGLGGSDKLLGKSGNDILIGGSGRDAFTFDTALNATNNVDTIKDFSVVDDTVRLSDAIFTKLDDGQLRSSWFRIGEEALDRNDYIVYNKDTGDLYYDKDGSGSAAAVKFAVIENMAPLAASDLIVF